MGIRDDILRQIKDFLEKWKIDRSTFGSLCNNNPKFVREMEKKDVRCSTLDKAIEFMMTYEKKAWLENKKGETRRSPLKY